MADTKISDLAQLSVLPDTTDELVIVDKSDTTMAASGTDKRIQFQNLSPNLGTAAMCLPIASAPASSATGAINTWYSLRVFLLSAQTLSGVLYRIGTTSNGNVRTGLFDAAGTTTLASRTTNQAQGTANGTQLVGFDSGYAAPPGRYMIVIWFSSATATWMGARHLTLTNTGTDAGGIPAPPGAGQLDNADRPIMTTY